MKFTIEHLSKSYDKKQVLRDVNFSFEAGKTPLFNCLNSDMILRWMPGDFIL